jgi:GT2 family glycosyltransferase
MSLTVPISVVIASKNRAQDIVRCIEGLRASKAAPAQIIVVDQSAARYELPEIDGLLHLYDPTLSGLAQARNVSIPHITAAGVFFIDDDVVLEPDCLDKLADAFARYPDTVGFQCVDLEPHEEGRLTAVLTRVFERGFFEKQPFTRDGQAELRWIGGFAMAFRTELMHKEQFDERLRGYCFGEDWEFTQRARRHGRLRNAEGAFVHHHFSTVNRDGVRRMLEFRWRNYHYFFKKLGADKDTGNQFWLIWWQFGEAYKWLRQGMGLPWMKEIPPGGLE